MPANKRARGKKDPNAPKKNWTSFMFFSNAKRAGIKAENPEASFGDLSKLIGAEFKSLDVDEKNEWIEKAAEDKKRYLAEMADYSAPSGSDDDEPQGKRKKKDPNAPKKNLSAYNYFFQAKREEIKNDNPDATFGEISKLVSQQFRALTENSRKKWDEKAAKDKKRYEKDMKAYDLPSSSSRSGKKSKPVKDPNAPKRNLSSYMLYSSYQRPKLKERYPDATFGELGSKLGEKFRNLSSKDKKKWEGKAAEDKKRYQREMEAYQQKQKESSEEESESEEESAESEEVKNSSEDEEDIGSSSEEEESDSD